MSHADKDTTVHTPTAPARPKRSRLTRIGVAAAAAALLAGGSGTFALWSVSADAGAGTITSDFMVDVTSKPGVWTSSVTGPVADIEHYRVAPGETLTFAQELKIVMEGPRVPSTLAVTGTGVNQGFSPESVTITGPVVAKKDGTVVDVATEPVSAGDYTATTTFSFLETVDGLESAEQVYDFSDVGYSLTPGAPAPAEEPPAEPAP